MYFSYAARDMEFVAVREYSVQVFFARSVMLMVPSRLLLMILPVVRSAEVALVIEICAPLSVARIFPFPVLEIRPVR